MNDERMKTVIWVGSSLKVIQSFPEPVRKDLGQALYTAQQGKTDPAAKPLKGFHGTQVMEIVDRYDTDTYRAVYTTQFEDVLYVLYAFQKKSKSGIATPQRDLEIIRKRLGDAKRDFEERKASAHASQKNNGREKQR